MFTVSLFSDKQEKIRIHESADGVGIFIELLYKGRVYYIVTEDELFPTINPEESEEGAYIIPYEYYQVLNNKIEVRGKSNNIMELIFPKVSFEVNEKTMEWPETCFNLTEKKSFTDNDEIRELREENKNLMEILTKMTAASAGLLMSVASKKIK